MVVVKWVVFVVVKVQLEGYYFLVQRRWVFGLERMVYQKGIETVQMVQLGLIYFLFLCMVIY